MKKLILFVGLLIGLSSISNAQVALNSRYSKQLDTVTNTGVKNMISLRVNTTAGITKVTTVSTVNTQLTGTMQGIARLFGSLDGVNYTRIRTAQLVNSQVDSLIITNTNNTRIYHWEVLYCPYKYFKVEITGVGTSTFTTKGQLLTN